MAELPTATPGVLTVGIDDSPPPPMELGEPGDPDFRGYEVDILKAVAERLGVELRYRQAVWSLILDELKRGELDVVCTAATYTPERARELDYGRPYLDAALAVVVRDDDEAEAAEDVRGRAFAVRSATTAEELIRERLEPAALHTFEYNAETYDALLAGQGGAVVDDHPIASWFVAERTGLRLVGDLPGTESYYAMVFAKGSPLREPLDSVLARLEADGLLAEWRRSWFG
jgi:polar amino acid transport system substrate-binding protein